MHKYLKIIFIILFSVTALSACKSKTPVNETSNSEQLVVTEQKHQNTLFYNATIKPLEVINVPCPIEGTISKLYFEYGQRVEKDQPLLSVRSTKLMQDYQETLTAYLKGKDGYLSDKQQAETNELLYSHGLIPRNTLETSQRAMADAYLGYMQAKQKLAVMLNNSRQFLDTSLNTLTALNLENMEDVQSAFAVELNELMIRAPTFGVILIPDKNLATSTGGGEDNGNKRLAEGSEVKLNSTLLSLGDFTGISLTINVNEIDINNIKPGQKANVTGIAFPNIPLKGYVGTIEAQAVDNPSGGLPVFPVNIIVANLPMDARKLIHIGMTAKVELLIEYPSTISVPINAVISENDKTLIMRIDPKTKKPEKIVVSTGKTEMDSVIITSGLKNGDTILVPHRSD